MLAQVGTYEHISIQDAIIGMMKIDAAKINTAKMDSTRLIGVIGAGVCDDSVYTLAHDVGYNIALSGAILVCGGLGGVMEAAAKGAKAAGGMTVGILPTETKDEANPYIDIPLATGLGHARNAIITRSCDVFIAIDGSYGTLSEIGLAKTMGKEVVGIKSWDIEGIIKAESAKEAVDIAIGLLDSN